LAGYGWEVRIVLKSLVFPRDDPRQEHRLRRFLMGAGAALMVLLLLALSSALGILPRNAFFFASGMMIALLAAFFLAFRSGFNKRFSDPSLTLAQILASTLVIVYCLAQSPRGHGILALIYMVSFLFGVFRLSTRELLGLTTFVAVSYGLILAVQGRANPNPERIGEDILRWIVIVAVLTFFSFMGGYISQLRKKLAEANVGMQMAMRRIAELAARDELTGVLNRRSMIEVLAQHKGRADRYGVCHSVLMMDLDFFKRVNDTYGHPAGDAVLCAFSSAAESILRETDSFGRYGGEEFLAVLDQTPLDGACVVGERICAVTKALKFEFDGKMRVSVSIGIAQYRAKEEWKSMVERADRALYRAKEGGRDRVERETPG
jgi:diguanylate cyclase